MFKTGTFIKTCIAATLLTGVSVEIAEARGYCSPRHLTTTGRLTTGGGTTIKTFSEGWITTASGTYLPRACEHRHFGWRHLGWTNREAFYAMPANQQAAYWQRHGYRTRHNGWSHHMPR